MDSDIKIYVERNLGFEAEHHCRDLEHLPGVVFHEDPVAKRKGVLTTEASKHAMCGLLNSMLREQRVHVSKKLVSRDAKACLVRLREQLEIYSYQFKQAETPFQRDRMCLGGKIGGMKDDLAICLQLVIFWANMDSVTPC